MRSSVALDFDVNDLFSSRVPIVPIVAIVTGSRAQSLPASALATYPKKGYLFIYTVGSGRTHGGPDNRDNSDNRSGGGKLGRF